MRRIQCMSMSYTLHMAVTCTLHEGLHYWKAVWKKSIELSWAKIPYFCPSTPPFASIRLRMKIKGLTHFNGNIKRCPLKLHVFNDFFCLIKNSVTELIFTISTALWLCLWTMCMWTTEHTIGKKNEIKFNGRLMRCVTIKFGADSCACVRMLARRAVFFLKFELVTFVSRNIH